MVDIKGVVPAASGTVEVDGMEVDPSTGEIVSEPRKVVDMRSVRQA